MKKFFALFAAILIATSALYAVEPTIANRGQWNPDDMSTLGKIVGNDLSFDYAQGEYKIFVICEIDIKNITGNIYLGWLNPDGAKDINGYPMEFKVTGGNGWGFEANAKFGTPTNTTDATAFAYNEQTSAPVTTVFITGSKWYYKVDDGTYTQVGSTQQFPNTNFVLSGTVGLFNNNDGNNPNIGDTYLGGITTLPVPTKIDNYSVEQSNWTENSSIVGKWNMHDAWNCTGCNTYQRSCDNACQGAGTFKLVPGTVWAAPNATEGFYTFPVYVEVDYLTFKNGGAWSFTGNAASDPGGYTAHNTMP